LATVGDGTTLGGGGPPDPVEGEGDTGAPISSHGDGGGGGGGGGGDDDDDKTNSERK